MLRLFFTEKLAHKKTPAFLMQAFFVFRYAERLFI